MSPMGDSRSPRRFATTSRGHAVEPVPDAGGDLGLVDAPVGASSMRVLQRQTVVVQ